MAQLVFLSWPFLRLWKGAAEADAATQLAEEALTRLELLEHVNQLNTLAEPGERYWTVTVLYNTVVYKAVGKEAKIFEVEKGVPA